MTYTILHISDLHRSPQDPIGNEALLSSLVSDFSRSHAETPPIHSPDAIVVSGDVIQGARLDDPNHVAIVEEQYDVALQLLNSLADRFLNGDHSRVIIVPGNHDVDWNIAYSAMEAIAEVDLPTNIRPADFGPTSDLRWNWKERKAYRITDPALYAKRLSHYQQFANRFYDGINLTYPMDASSDYCLFELNKRRIGVAAFNSCDGNDCFAYHGAISERSLAQAHIDLHDQRPQYDLMMAVWHHNVEGPPGAADYMDVATIYNLIGRGFRLGLHGHQHRAETTNRFVHLPHQEPMAVVSAGSLCAGPVDLPTGVNRQYNIIEISDDCSSARVHVREMVIASVFAPARRAEFGWESYIDMSLGKPLSAELPERARDDARILGAERAIVEGDPHRALALLQESVTSPGSYARTLTLKAATAAEDWTLAVKVATPPDTIEELGGLVASLVELQQFDEAAMVLEQYAAALGVENAARTDLQNYVAAKRSLA
jgi:hypothetical protein